MTKRKLNTESITFVTDEDTREKLILYTFSQNASIGAVIRGVLKRWLRNNNLTIESLVSEIAERMNASWKLKLLKHQADPSKGMESKAEFMRKWESDLIARLSTKRVEQILDYYEKNYK